MDLPAQQSELEWSNLEGPYYLVSQRRIDRTGTALCMNGVGNYRIYRVKEAPEGRMPLAGVEVILKVTERLLAGKRICGIVRRDPGGLASSAANGDGRRIPLWEAAGDERITIEPRGPIAELLKGR